MISNRRYSAPLITAAVLLWGTWAVATYALEGYPRTLLRPEAVGMRVAYALVANVVVGILGAGAVLHYFSRRMAVAPQLSGFRSTGRILASLALGLALGFAMFLFQRPVTSAPVIITNAFAQVWVVSVAEVLVCWVVLGTAIRLSLDAGSRRWVALAAAWAIAAIAFGVYHFAHSPPFNTLQMVGLLTVVGLATGAFFFTVGEIYGTIVFHNFLALKGVTDALAASDALDQYATLHLPLIFTALAATGALIAVHQFLHRNSRELTAISA
jgi:hypothetical protein